MIANPTNGRRGGVYIAVLGVTSMVTVIGISGVLLAQVEREASEATLSTGAARYDAQSALCVALDRVSGSSQWATDYPSKTWQSAETFGQGKWSFMLDYDQASADAGDTVDVTFTALASRDVAARAFSIDAVVTTTDAPNELSGDDADFEGGKGAWYGLIMTVAQDTSTANSGTASLKSSARLVASFGPDIQVTGWVQTGKTYDFSAYVKMDTGNADNVSVILTYNDASLIPKIASFTTATKVGDTWTKVTGTLSPDTGGAPITFGWIRVATTATNGNFWIDDVTITDTSRSGADVEVTPGTFRQRVIE